jgi:CHAD domain-containing protein
MVKEMKNKLRPVVQPVFSLRSAAAVILNLRFIGMWNYHELLSGHYNEEIIHDMRVASRRYRAALTDFKCLFSKKDFKQLYAPAHQLTRILGCARDWEVTIDLIKKAIDPDISGTDDFPVSLLEYSQSAFNRSREELQGFIRELYNNNYPEIFRTCLSRIKNPDCGTPAEAGKSFVYHMYQILPVRVGTFYEAAEAIKKPRQWSALHDLRIATKRLRYSLELYDACFDRDYDPVIEIIKTVQEKLGNLQDRVMINEHLRKYSKTHSKPVTLSEATIPDDPVQILIKRFISERNAFYMDYELTWEQVQNSNFIFKIENMIRQSFLKYIRQTRDLNIMEQLFIDEL